MVVRLFPEPFRCGGLVVVLACGVPPTCYGVYFAESSDFVHRFVRRFGDHLPPRHAIPRHVGVRCLYHTHHHTPKTAR